MVLSLPWREARDHPPFLLALYLIMADVAIVIGHHPDAKGTALRIGEKTIQEYDLWRPFAEGLAASLEPEPAIVTRPNPDPDYELARRVNATGAECAVELHFNAWKEPSVSGTEMLHHADSEAGQYLAHLLHDHTAEALGTKRRGLKARRTPGDSWPFLGMTEMPAVIAEPAFGSHRGDAWKLLTRQPQLLLAYKEAIEQWFSDTGGAW